MPGWIRLGRINMLLDVAMLLLNGAMPPKTVVFPNRAYPCGKLSLWGSRDANLDVLQGQSSYLHERC